MSVAGCGLLDVDAVSAFVTVDPTVVRTIHRRGLNGWDRTGERTNLPVAEMSCLGEAPVSCYVQERIAVTLHNTGERTLTVDWCEAPLEHLWMGAWHPVGTEARCVTAGDVWYPIIAPGGEYTALVNVADVPVGDRYRVQLRVFDGDPVDQLVSNDVGDLILERFRTSEPFSLIAAPGSSEFVCPTQNRATEAAQIARDRLAGIGWGSDRSVFPKFVELESRFPGFGGTDVADKVFKVHVKSGSQAEAQIAAVVAAVRDIWQQTPTVVKSRYSYSELVGWLSVVQSSGIERIRGVAVEVDPSKNAVVFHLPNSWRLEEIECLIRGVGMPAEMAVVEIAE